MQDQKPAGLKIGPLAFQPGVTYGNVAAVVYSGFITVALMSYINFVQPFLLSDILHIPADQQGSVTGNLVLLQEIIILTLMGFSGALSDRVGRRIIFVVGFLVLAAGYFLYPLVDNVAELYGARALFAFGAAIAPIMLTACVVDLIHERSRGRWVGFISVITALGAVFMALVLSRLPKVFMARGLSAGDAAEYAYWVAAALCVMTSLILWFGIRGGVLSVPAPVAQQRPSAIKGVTTGIRAAITNPRLGLALAGGFIGRGDFAVVGTFFSLWIVQAGQAKGMPSGEALAYAGRMFGLVQLSAMIWGACMGVIADRIDRTSALALAAVLAAIGYGVLSLVGDPFSGAMLAVAVLAGIGEVSVVVAASSLLGEQAPTDKRGALSGLYGVLGALGIAVVSFIGGQLFDIVAWHAPFMLMVGFNVALAIAAFVVRSRGGAGVASAR